MKIAEEMSIKIAAEVEAAGDANLKRDLEATRVVLWGRDSDLLLHSHITTSVLIRSVNWRKDTCECVSLETLLQSPSSLFSGFDTIDVLLIPGLFDPTLDYLGPALALMIVSSGLFACSVHAAFCT